ncbi:hypothetical protein HOY80DRAFT_1058382 [Tuber brumale]|nr:hypothetical protein HOY80DRAFT_1058382 [Tuber brumale]
MGFQKSRSSVRDLLATVTVLQKTAEKSLALELENSKLRHHVSVLSWRLHKVIAKLKIQSKIMVAFCPFCGGNYNQMDCVDWLERVEEEGRGMERVEFSGSVDVEPLVVEEELVVEVREKIMVRLLMAVAGSVARATVAEDVAMVEVAEEEREVAVVDEGVEGGVGSCEEDWTVVRRKVRERKEVRRRRMEEERDAVRKRMNVWRPDKVLVNNALLKPRGVRVVREVGVDRVGGWVVLVVPISAPRRPAEYQGICLGSERMRGGSGGGIVPIEFARRMIVRRQIGSSSCS